MEEIKSLVTKPTEKESAEKWKNSTDNPQTLGPRQLAIVALIQRTQSRRGFPPISPGWELRNALSAWGDALKAVPDEYLSRAYDRAAENWPWTDGKAFTADAVADAYKVLLVEDRQRDEAEKRNARARNPDTYRCFHCQDTGYQQVYYYRYQHWYSSQRGCSCDAAPVTERHSAPLTEPEYLKSKYGSFAKRSDVEKYGVPCDAFKNFTVVK
jgi:hypothetical protein